MSKLTLQRIRFSVEADNRLKMLKARTGLTPNLLCRLGFCLSLQEPGFPLSDDSEVSSREINRFTLLGEYDQLFVALLCVRHQDEVRNETELSRLFVAHMHRGIALLANRAKSIAAVLELVPSPAHAPAATAANSTIVTGT